MLVAALLSLLKLGGHSATPATVPEGGNGAIDPREMRTAFIRVGMPQRSPRCHPLAHPVASTQRSTDVSIPKAALCWPAGPFRA